MKRFLEREDIQIRDIIIPEDARAGGYNIGDLLNMPSLYGIWGQNPHASENGLNRMNILGNAYKNSVLWHYCTNRKSNSEIVPNVDLIVESVKKFTEENVHSYRDIMEIAKDPETCCVHVRSGDKGTEDDFVEIISNISKKYKRIILLSGIHLDTFFSDNQTKITNYQNTINSILSKNENIFVFLNSADVHLSIMASASNLLLHKGGFSCLGSIVSTGNLFVTKYFYQINYEQWKNQVNKKYTVL